MRLIELLIRKQNKQAKAAKSAFNHLAKKKATGTERDVLSYAEDVQRRKDLLEVDKYTITLPFDISDAPSWQFVADTVEWTIKGWDWFERGRKMVDSKGRLLYLGTLGYLPFEIRNQVYHLVLNDHLHTIVASYKQAHEPPTNNSQQDQDVEDLSNWQLHYQPRGRGTRDHKPSKLPDDEEHTLPFPEKYDGLAVFDFRSYLPRIQDDGGVSNLTFMLHLASKSLLAELDYVFLTRFTFKFDCPRGLREFLARLPSSRKTLVRAINLEIMGLCQCFGNTGWCTKESKYKDWMEIGKSLPDTLESLRSVDFEVGESAHAIPFGGRAGYWTSDGDRDGGFPTHVFRIAEVLDLLELLVQQFARSSSMATI